VAADAGRPSQLLPVALSPARLHFALAVASMSPANAILVFPANPELRQLSDKRIPLAFGPPHPRSRNGHPILVDPDAEVVTLEVFRRLRVKLAAWIETDGPALVREALGVPDDEPGIVPFRAGGVTALL